ncbi:hypothetical protein BO99DRAFT_406430 [Aspergillus violaceofuscus CBS 115571]|uniref:Uncharacterized protein n=1 Tax=Aspergillus violaceofuscus (strain CBS 115571) TaxID=1450538 RepID=A0A2V5I520_ASPV1|nr:hypothetical protein BO99DRAFT_406430 [Aspergillus violaceofuscus CBS 115571]
MLCWMLMLRLRGSGIWFEAFILLTTLYRSGSTMPLYSSFTPDRGCVSSHPAERDEAQPGWHSSRGIGLAFTRIV